MQRPKPFAWPFWHVHGAVTVTDLPALASCAAASAAAPAFVPSEPVYIAVEEKLSVVLNKDGGLENMEVQGTMSLQVGDVLAGARLLGGWLGAKSRVREDVEVLGAQVNAVGAG